MALFDNFGKKASEAGQNAIQKAKDLSEISRLNGIISDEEKAINNTYYQIGKLYATVHRDDPEPDFAGMVSAITGAETRIGEYKKQIQDIKGVQRCENCGAEAPKGAAFCSTCGAAMPKIESIPDDSIKCGNCGAVVKKGMRFCTSCGNPMEIAPPAVPEPMPTPVPAPAPVVEPQMVETPGAEAAQSDRVCSQCGAKINDDSAFCTECGAKL